MLDMMFLPHPRKDLFRRFSFPALHGFQTLLNALDGFCTVNEFQQSLICSSILDHHFRLAIDREHFWTAGFLEPFDVLLGMTLEIGQRVNIFHMNHRPLPHEISMLFHANMEWGRGQAALFARTCTAERLWIGSYGSCGHRQTPRITLS